MRKIFNIIIKEFGTLFLAVVAIAAVYPYEWVGPIPLSVLLIGVLYNLIKPLYDYRKRSVRERWYRLGKWMLNLLYQTWVVIRQCFLFIAYIVDLYSNVILGELVEDCVTASENTLFGLGDVTISAALGDLKRQNKLNRVGLWLCKVLSWLDPKHEDHCIAAIELYEFKNNQK